MTSYRNYSLYDTVARIPESQVGNVTFSVLSEQTSTMSGSSHRNGKRPILIVAVACLVVTIITGVVVWKVTKDAYDNSDSDAASQLNTPAGSDRHDAVGSSTRTTDGGKTTVEPQTTLDVATHPWLELRMPRDVLPIHYDITMYPDFYGDGSRFYGNETIELSVVKPTHFILIHIHTTYLNVSNTRVRDRTSSSDIGVKRTFYYAPNEFWVIELDSELRVSSTIDLILEFEGSLVKGITGIYKSTYINTVTRETRHITTSKFEPTDARRAFPCFDEPNIKAEYTIKLVHKPDYIALSNMPVEGQSTPNPDYQGLVSTKFMRSVKMSTYLVCFIVCDFEYKETFSESKIPVRVYATPDKINQVDYALDLAKHTLDLYEKLFNMSYPLPKQDLIAIPDFVSGAMEHWGLITFRESRLLVDYSKSSLGDIERVALTTAHEMAHMWFGNIVTMDWWNDLWLNEGFASYMEYLGVEDKQPEWQILDSFLVRDLFPVMKDDSKASSHPIIVDVERPSQITSVFDAISYSKGSSVIRMLMSILGKGRFFKGVANYLKEQKWGNAKTDDLWRSLGNVKGSGTVDFDVKQIMDSWTIQDGFPYVNVTWDTSNAGKTMTAAQERFISSPGVKVDSTQSPLGYKWYIALDYISSQGDTGTHYMDMKDAQFEAPVDLSQGDSWVKFNHDQNGFYRVLYPDAMWTRFSTYLSQTDASLWTLSGADRSGLLNDAFALAGAGLASYEVPLNMMSYLRKEREYVPWNSAINGGILYIHDMLETDPDFTVWKKFLAAKLKPVLEDLGFVDDPSQKHVDRNLRSLLMSVACMVEEPTTLAHVKQDFFAWMNNNTVPANELRRIVYRYGLANFGMDEHWEEMWQLYLVESSPSEKERLSDALAHARQPHLITRLLKELKDGLNIKRQDFFTIVRNIGRNPTAANILWNWTRENYQAFVDRFSISDRYFGRMVYYMVRGYNSEFKLNEVKALFDQFPEAGSGERYRKMAIESIEGNIYWMKHYKNDVVGWLSKHSLD